MNASTAASGEAHAAERHIELIARGVLIGSRGLLLCRNVGRDYCYLPGGHIEFGEPAAVALEREVEEELGMKVQVDGFLGAIEASFVQGGKLHHEISLVFEMTSNAIAHRARLVAAEAHLEFFWQPVHELAHGDLLPRALRTLIPTWTLGKHQAWMSAMELK